MSEPLTHHCCPVCSYEWEASNPPSKCPFCEIELSLPLPVSAYSEEEWACTIQRAERLERRTSPPQPPLSDLGAIIFGIASDTNRAMTKMWRMP